MKECDISKEMHQIMMRIKLKRTELKMSYQELANKTGISKSNLQRYENGYIKNMPIDKFIPIANALDTTISYLLGLDNDTESSLILTYYNELNQMGKKEAEKRIEELTHMDKYTNTYHTEILNAAHEIPGATEEEKQHDEDIMNDENF